MADKIDASNIRTIPFKPGDVDTIGMEIEYQLLDPVSLELVEGILPLMARYPDNEFIKPEFIQNTVEVASPVCHSIDELDQQVRLLVRELLANCKDLNIALCGAGTHSFSRKMAEITPLQRFLAMETKEGYTSHTQITFAMHVHLGMRSGDEAIAIMRALTTYLPMFIALSASSPFWRGHDTNYDSFRHFILAAIRSYGEPPSFRDWQDFCDFFSGAQRAGIFESINDIHWDIRPRPHLGSLEIRVMDTQPTVSDAIGLAAFLQALVVYLRAEVVPCYQCVPNALHQWLNRDNYYKAAHHGLKANYFDERRDKTIPITQLYNEVSRRIAPAIAELNTQDFCDQVTQLVHIGGCAEYQRQLVNQSHSFKSMAANLVKALEIDIHHGSSVGVFYE